MKTLRVSKLISTRIGEKNPKNKKTKNHPVNFDQEAKHTIFWISILLHNDTVLQSFANSIFPSYQKHNNFSG